MAKSTGGGGSLTVAGTSIGFNTVSPSVKKDYDDATDSTNYDTGTQIVHKTQLAVATQTTLEVEGKIDLTTVPSVVVATMYSNPGAVSCALKYNGSSTYGHGLVDITDFKGTIDPMKVLNFTATLLSNGVWTPNA